MDLFAMILTNVWTDPMNAIEMQSAKTLSAHTNVPVMMVTVVTAAHAKILMNVKKEVMIAMQMQNVTMS